MTKNNPAPTLADTFHITDVETLKVLAHPQRLEILRNLDTPRTVKEVAERIGADPTKLYYHIRMMEKAGLIMVTETNVVSGIIEKHYSIVAHDYRMAEGLVRSESFSNDEFDQMVASVFEGTRQEMRKTFEAGKIDLEQEFPNRTTALMSVSLSLTDEQLKSFNERMQTIMEDVERWSEENKALKPQEYMFTIAFFPRTRSD